MGYPQTNRKIDTGKTLNRWPVLVDHYSVSTSGINPVIRIERHENCEQFIRSDKSSYLAFGNKRHGYDKHMHRGCWRAFRIHLLEGLNLSLKDKYLHYIKRAERRRSPLASFQCPKCCETIKTLGAPKGFVELKA